MEGKETRFGISASSLFATVTTDASCGAVNSMHDSFTPIGGAIPLINLYVRRNYLRRSREAGLYGMLMYMIVAVFIAGLYGRTGSRIWGKKNGEVRSSVAIIAVLYIFVFASNVIPLTCIIGQFYLVRAMSITSGPHGFSEILYAFCFRDRQQRLGIRGVSANTILLQHDSSA